MQHAAFLVVLLVALLVTMQGFTGDLGMPAAGE